MRFVFWPLTILNVVVALCNFHATQVYANCLDDYASSPSNTGAVEMQCCDAAVYKTLPASIAQLQSLTHLDLSDCLLVGTLPPQLGALTNLQGMYLFNNDMRGTIPPKWDSLTALTHLALDNNALTGEIPSQLCGLMNLKGLDLFKNNLSGDLPVELGQLVSLEYLYLDMNKLAGPIPITLQNLTALRELYVNGNEITGSVPLQLNVLTKLDYVHIAGNRLHKPLPNLGSTLFDISNSDLVHLSAGDECGTDEATQRMCSAGEDKCSDDGTCCSATDPACLPTKPPSTLKTISPTSPGVVQAPRPMQPIFETEPPVADDGTPKPSVGAGGKIYLDRFVVLGVVGVGCVLAVGAGMM